MKASAMVAEDSHCDDIPYGHLLVVVFLCLGVLTTFVNPPFHAPDEQAHWIIANERAADLFGGRLAKCDSIHTLNGALGSVAQHPDERMPRGRYAALGRPPADCQVPPIDVPYGSVFTYFGVLISRWLVAGEDVSQRQSLAVFLLARMLHGLAVGLTLLRLAALSKRAAVPGSLLVIAFCCSPLFVHQSFAVSSDPVCLLWAVSIATVCLHWPRLRAGDLALHVAITLIVATTKPTLLPAGLAALLVAFAAHGEQPFFNLRALWQNRPRGRQFAKNAAVVVAGSYGLAVVLAVLVTANVQGAETRLHLPPGVEPAAQRQLIFAHPLTALVAMAKPLAYVSLPHLQVGPLGWLDFSPSRVTGALWGVLVVLCFGAEFRAFLERTQAPSSKNRRWIIAAAVVAFASASALSLAAIAYAMFLFHTPVGAHVVVGVQPRYISPIWVLWLAVGCLGAAKWIPTRTTELPRVERAPTSWSTKLPRMGAWAFALLLGTVGVVYIVHLSMDFAARYW